MGFKNAFSKALLGMDKVLTEVNPLFGLAAPLLTAIQPKSVGVVAKVGTDIDTMIGIVANAQAVRDSLNLTGAQAAQVAGPNIAQMVLSALTLSGKKPKDAALFKTQCASLAGIMNDIVENFD